MPERSATSSAKGRVILVGAGPGDPGLLTLAAKEALDSADIILHDRLIGDAVLAALPARAEKIDVGKTCGRHPVPQEEINRLLLEHALRGKTVVRLKGGDPYLFGRGAEELEAIAARGIPFRVVPGVTSAIAAPACAGIPVTHRDIASSLHVFTGHGKGGQTGSAPRIPFAEAARLCAAADGAAGGTLVFLMGVGALEEICAGLANAGLSPETPAALVENGTRPNQRRLSATLGTLPARAHKEAFGTPAVLVVGGVCALAGALDRTEALPLRGRKILTVCTRTTGSRLAAILRGRGGDVDEFAAVTTEPLPLPPAFWEEIRRYGWIAFTSEFGVDCLFAALAAADRDVRAVAHARFAVVGGRTRDALARQGIRADHMPDEYSGGALGDSLAARVGPRGRVLLFRAAAGGDGLPAALRRGGISFDDVAAYRTLPQAPARNVLDTLRAGGYDAVAFSSASSVDALARSLPAGAPPPRAFCIGAATARAAERHGMSVTAAAAATLEALADAVTNEWETA